MFTRLREDIASIRERDPAARSAWEVLTCYPGLHAIILHRWANRCWRHGFRWMARFISHVARGLTGIEIHPGATIGRKVFIDHGMGVVIGETAEVGDECTIYQGVTLGGTSLHRGAKRHPTLGRGVIIGAGAKVLGGFTVGDGARIGSNAVVVKEVPAGATAVGNPAHIVQKEEQKQREAAAARMFSAYGISSNADDPLSLALQGLINHVATQEHQLKKMMAAMKSAGMSCEQVLDADKFDPEQLNKLVE
ncbi:MAG: serine acetyltransferase [Paucimonas sp.]|jgi:serine O-acetyltransferase|nr:serine acetyltransferase [Paucimonas sp.]